MVTSQINGLGFTAAVSADTAYVPLESENAFLQALQGQMPTATAPVAQEGQISPEALERITAFVQNLAIKEGNGTDAIVKRIMEILIARITGGDTGKKTQEKEQIGELSENNVGFDEIPRDIFELIAQELQEIIDQQASDFGSVGVQLSVRTVSLSLTSEPTAKAMPSQTKVQPDAFLNPQALSETSSEAAAHPTEQVLHLVKSQTTATTEFTATAPMRSEIPLSVTGQSVPVASDAPSIISVEKEPQQTPQTVLPQAQPSENTTLFTDVQLEAKAEKILSELISFAKSELGLSKAEIVYSEHKPEQTRQFFSVQTMVKTTADANTELAQLIGEVSTQENADSAQNGFTLRPQITKGEIVVETENVTVSDEVAFEAVTQTVELPQTFTQGDQFKPTEVQVAQRVYQAISTMKPQDNGEVTFRMTLNPEFLGEIEVTITATEGKATVEIITQSKQTQSILAERLEGLQTALKQEGVELEKYQVVYAPNQAQNESRSYDGSSKNPYSRRQSERNEETDESIEFSEILKAL